MSNSESESQSLMSNSESESLMSNSKSNIGGRDTGSENCTVKFYLQKLVPSDPEHPVFISRIPVLFVFPQSLRDDLKRQTDREKELQKRFADLTFERDVMLSQDH